MDIPLSTLLFSQGKRITTPILDSYHFGLFVKLEVDLAYPHYFVFKVKDNGAGEVKGLEERKNLRVRVGSRLVDSPELGSLSFSLCAENLGEQSEDKLHLTHLHPYSTLFYSICQPPLLCA